MPIQVVTGATMMCTFGTAPSALVATPKTIMSSSLDAANILDYKPTVNIPPFAMCTSLANPTVASATSAAMGVLTPMPCVPATVAPWVVGAVTVHDQSSPALNNTSCLNCAYGGVISILNPGQYTHQVP